MAIVELLKDHLRHFKAKNKEVDIERQRPEKRNNKAVSSSDGDEVIHIPTKLIATVRKFGNTTTGGQLSNILLWMFSYDDIQKDAKFSTRPGSNAPTLISDDELRAWFEVSTCIEAEKPPRKRNGLKKATKELGLSWEKDVSWRLRRLILFSGGKFPDQSIAPVFRSAMNDVAKTSFANSMSFELQRLRRFVQALKPLEDRKTCSWGNLKARLLEKIDLYTSSRTSTSEVLLALPLSFRVLFSAEQMWYYSQKGVDHECNRKKSRFLELQERGDRSSRSSTPTLEGSLYASKTAPGGSLDTVRDPEEEQVQEEEDSICVDPRELLWRSSLETKPSMPLREEDIPGLACTPGELITRMEALSCKSQQPGGSSLKDTTRSSSRVQQHSRRQSEASRVNLLAWDPDGYSPAQEYVPVCHPAQPGVQRPPSVAASDHSSAPLPESMKEDFLIPQPAPPQTDRCREDWSGWGQRRDPRSRISQPQPENPFFERYGQGNAHLPRTSSNPCIDPAHGGPFAVPPGVFMPSFALVDRCWDRGSSKPEAAREFLGRDLGMRGPSPLQGLAKVDPDEVNPSDLNHLGVNRQYVHHAPQRYHPNGEAPRQYAPNPGMRRSATTRGVRGHDQGRDYGIFDQPDPYSGEPGYTSRGRPNRSHDLYFMRRPDRRPQPPGRPHGSDDHWGISPDNEGPRIVRRGALHKYTSPAFGVHLQRPSKVTRLKRSNTKA